MKKNIKSLKLYKTYFLLLAAIVAAVVASCVYIDEFIVAQIDENGNEVYYAKANTEATFTLRGHIECHEDHNGVNFVVGFLAPKSWKVAENGRVTYKCDLAEDHDQILTMSPIPSTSLPKNGSGRTWVECLTQDYGVGTNVLDDMEWVVFQTDDKFNIINNQFPTYTIYITTNVGEKNLKCHLGVFVNHTDDGFSGGNDHKKVLFSSDCFEVVGGTGITLDFCNDHFNKISPMTCLQNDFVTFTFKGSAAENGLTGVGDIYLQGTAYTVNGGKYMLNTRDAKSRMERENAYSDTYNITFWPVELFGVPEDEVIERIEYYFTNSDGSITVTQSDDDFAQLGTPLPEEKQPFLFQFECE
ncbi:MAG: DUF4961 domain-containing protein [Prevotella sp.]|nr:DUF4961 domain-containing protein [Prevotella sp.]